MNPGNRRIIIFAVLGLIWGASILLIMAPSLGLATPVFPRPQPDYELYIMLVSGIILIGHSIKTGVDYMRP